LFAILTHVYHAYPKADNASAGVMGVTIVALVGGADTHSLQTGSTARESRHHITETTMLINNQSASKLKVAEEK
jgi:hypothetical protein